MKIKVLFIAALAFILASCGKNAELTNVVKKTKSQSLKELAKAQVQIDRVLANLDISNKNLEWEKFAADLSAVQSEHDVDLVLIKYDLAEKKDLKSTLVSYAKELSIFSEETNFAQLPDYRKKEYAQEYVEIYQAEVNDGDVIANHRNFGECIGECYTTGLENGLLCAAGCLGGPIGCWVAVGCAIINSRQLNRCYRGCRDSYPQEAK